MPALFTSTSIGPSSAVDRGHRGGDRSRDPSRRAATASTAPAAGAQLGGGRRRSGPGCARRPPPPAPRRRARGDRPAETAAAAGHERHSRRHRHHGTTRTRRRPGGRPGRRRPGGSGRLGAEQEEHRPGVTLVGIVQAPHARRLLPRGDADGARRGAAGDERGEEQQGEDVGAGSSRHFIVRCDRPKGVYSDAMPRGCVLDLAEPGRRAAAPGHEGAAAAGLRRAARRSSPRCAGRPSGCRDLTLMGGIHLGDYPWARPEHAALRCATWHMSPRLEDARRRGRVEFLPLRYFDAVAAFARGGAWAPDCVLVQTAPPDAARLSEPRRLGQPRAAGGARGAARHRPGESEHAAHPRQRVAAPRARSTCAWRSTSR